MILKKCNRKQKVKKRKPNIGDKNHGRINGQRELYSKYLMIMKTKEI